MPGSRFTDIRRFESIDSTNRYLLEEARGGAPDGVVAVADHQSAGRGRLGRRWEAPPGANLLVSVLLRPDLPADQRQLAGAVVALAATDAVAGVAGVDVGIKWPNDLLGPDGRKLAGVLAEADLSAGPTDGTLPPPIVVGIGINVNWPRDDGDLPAELLGSATSLCQLVGRARRPGRAPRRPARLPSGPGSPTWSRWPAGPARPATSGPGAPRSGPGCGWSWPTTASRGWPPT